MVYNLTVDCTITSPIMLFSSDHVRTFSDFSLLRLRSQTVGFDLLSSPPFVHFCSCGDSRWRPYSVFLPHCHFGNSLPIRPDDVMALTLLDRIESKIQNFSFAQSGNGGELKSEITSTIRRDESFNLAVSTIILQRSPSTLHQPQHRSSTFVITVSFVPSTNLDVTLLHLRPSSPSTSPPTKIQKRRLLRPRHLH
ncbi:hypothetical protein ACLOJK_027350 [Asimina triloba]